MKKLPKLPKPRREDLPPDASLCDHCTAKCCKYFALPIDTPDTWQEFDYMRWYLLHEHASIFVEDGTWYLIVHTSCAHLQADNRCGIYHTRPQICRDYSTKDCEYEDSWTYQKYFELPEQIEQYAEATMPLRRGASLRSKPPELLPIV